MGYKISSDAIRERHFYSEIHHFLRDTSSGRISPTSISAILTKALIKRLIIVHILDLTLGCKLNTASVQKGTNQSSDFGPFSVQKPDPKLSCS